MLKVRPMQEGILGFQYP